MTTPQASKLPDEYNTAMLGATVSLFGEDQFAYSLRTLIRLVMRERECQPPEAREIILAEFIKPNADTICWINDELIEPIEEDKPKIVIPKKIGHRRWK